MQIDFRNFGPIASGQLLLKPLTVLIGPNQAGKSFAATAIYAFLRAFRQMDTLSRFAGVYYGYGEFVPSVRDASEGDQISQKRLKNLRDTVLRSETNHPVLLSKEQTAVLNAIGPAAPLRTAVRTSFQETFAAVPSDLARQGSRDSFIEFKQDEFFVRLELRTPEVQTATDLERIGPIYLGYGDRRRRDDRPPSEGQTVLLRPADRAAHEDLGKFRHNLHFAINKLLRLPQFPEVPSVPGCLYVPAIRSGLLLSHRLFLALLLRNVARAGIAPLAIPQMTGVVADFLQALIAIPDRKPWPRPSRELHELIDSAEERIAGGTVYYGDSGTSDALPNLRYKTPNGLELPLNLTSSAVTEVAPLFLLLRTITRRKSWVIVEEPEAHLSPGNQRHMAEFLVNLVHAGVNLIVTTHSSYLMEQLNNAIAAHTHGRIPDAPPPISHEDVAAYMVGPLKKRAGTVIRSLDVDPISGIDVSTFTQAYEDLYEQSFKIRGAAGEA